MMPRLITTVALLAAIGAGLWAFGSARYSAGQQAERAVYRDAAIEGERENARIERHRHRLAQEVQDAYAHRAARARAAAASATAAHDSLLDATAARIAAARNSCAASGADDAAKLGDVVRACTGAIRGLATHADACEARLTGLQAWVRGVCVTQPTKDDR